MAKNVIQSIRNGKVSQNIDSLAECILMHYFTGTWSEYEFKLQDFQMIDIKNDLLYISPIAYSLHREIFNLIKISQKVKHSLNR